MRVRKKAAYLLVVSFLVSTCLFGPLFIHSSARSYDHSLVSNGVGSYRIAFHPARTGEANAYIFALSYMEQFANAVQNLFQLGKVSKARLVVPSLHSSRVFGLPNFNPFTKNESQFDRSVSEYIEIEAVARESCGVNMSSFEEFLLLSHRQIVLFHPVAENDFKKTSKTSDLQKYFAEFLPPSIQSELLSGCMQSGPCSCKDKVIAGVERLQAALNQLTQPKGVPNFTIVDVICFNGQSYTSFSQLLHSISGDPDKVSYIFTHWSGNKCGPRPSEPNRCSFRPGGGTILMLENRNNYHVCLNLAGKLASYVHPHYDSLATKFLARQGVTPDSHLVTIHFRSEKLLLNEHNIFRCCFREMISVLNKLKEQQPDLKLVIISDVGPYGTTSCSDQMRNVSRRMFAANGLSPVYFDPIEFGVKDGSNNLLAGLTEVKAVSQGSQVILVGGGQFQLYILESLLVRSQTMHRSPKVYSICSPSTAKHLQDVKSKTQNFHVPNEIVPGDECVYS